MAIQPARMGASAPPRPKAIATAFVVQRGTFGALVNRLGTAYAIMFLIQNIGLMLISPVVGWGEAPAFATGVFERFQVSTLILAALGALGLVFAVLLKLSDRRAKVSIEEPEGG